MFLHSGSLLCTSCPLDDLSISGPSPYADMHWGSDQQSFWKAGISVGSVLQTNLPHDHKKALSEEVQGEKWVLASPMSLKYVRFEAVVY